MSVVSLTGNNSFLIDQAIKARVDISTKDYGADSVERLDARDMDADAVLTRFNAISMFAPKSLLVVKGVADNSVLCEKFIKVISKQRPANDLVIVETKLDKRSKLYKALKEYTDLQELNTPAAYQLSGWAQKWAKEHGGDISSHDAMYLVEMVGPNQSLIASEIEKLTIYNKNITKISIDKLVEPNPQSNVFNLIDATIKRDYKNVVRLYSEQQELKVDQRQIIGSLAWQLHIIALVKLSGSNSLSEIANRSLVNPGQLDKARQLAGNINFNDLVFLINKLMKLDIKIKSKAINADDALLYFLLSF